MCVWAEINFRQSRCRNHMDYKVKSFAKRESSVNSLAYTLHTNCVHMYILRKKYFLTHALLSSNNMAD